MTITITSPITGTAQTGLTSPTYTVVADSPPGPNAECVGVTALGGTQTGVTTNTVSSPFSVTFWKPLNYKVLGKPNPTTGLIANVPMNTYKVITRKGVTPLAGQPIRNMVITTMIEVPAGADTADSANVRAALSAHIGSLDQQSAGLGDMLINGLL
jgi:hypothetical protein